MQGEDQANVTFRLTATRQRPMGTRGELGGIGKLDPEDVRPHVRRAREIAMENTRPVLSRIVDKLQNQLDTDNTLTEDQRRNLEWRRNWFQEKLDSEEVLFKQMDLRNFGEDANDPIIQKALAISLLEMNQERNGDIYGLLGIQEQEGEVGGTAMLTRAVGTSKLDQLLGTNVISEERFGVDEQGRTVGISVRVDGFGVVGKLEGNREYQLDIDYSRHEVQKGLYDLEVIDYITGQIDRHAGNMFIDPETGEVKGIDNDLCFPRMPREQMIAGLRDARGKVVVNKPLFMHEDTARKIEELTPEQLRKTLGSLKYPGRGERGKLTPEEIEGAVTRLNEMKQHVRELRESNHLVGPSYELKEFNKATYDEAIRHQRDAFAEEHANDMVAESRSLDTVQDPRALNLTFKTSYLGSILCEQRRTEIAQEENVARLRLDPEGVRTETNSTGKSPRSEEHVEFARLEKERREELRPFKKAPMQEEFDRLDERVTRMERRLERLEHPNLWDRFKAIWHGGVEGAKRAFQGKRQEALNDIDALKSVLEQNLNQSLDDERGGRWQQARENVENRRLQDQGNNVGLHQSQKVDVNLGEEIDGRLLLNPEKLGMVDTKPHKPGFVLKDSSEISINEGEKVELNKQSSVRDLMKSRDGEKSPKVTNELEHELDDDSVRSQVGVKKTDPSTQKGQSFKTQ